MKIDELEKSIKQNDLKGIYLLYGEERFLLESCVKNIKKAFGEKILGINYIMLDDTNIEELISDMETPAFGFEKKLIIAKNTNFFGKEAKKKTKSQNIDFKEKVNEYINKNINEINESVVLVFIEEKVEKCELFSTIEKYGIVCNFEYQKPQQIQARLKAIINAYGVNIEMNTLQYLIEGCGTDMQDLINETRKLVEFAGKNGTITREAVDKLTIKKIESVIFDLTDNLGKKNVKEAINVLRNLIASKEPVQKILITLYNHFKKLYLTKVAIENNKDIIKSLDLKPNQSFLVNKYRNQANLFKKSELKQIIEEFWNLDFKSKIGVWDLQTGLESILCAYI